MPTFEGHPVLIFSFFVTILEEFLFCDNLICAFGPRLRLSYFNRTTMMIDFSILVVPDLCLFSYNSLKRGDTHLRVSMYVCTRTSMNGSRRLKMSQMSIIFSNSAEFTLNYIFTLTYDVLGRLFDTFMNMVVSTSIAREKKSINLGLKGVCLLG